MFKRLLRKSWITLVVILLLLLAIALLFWFNRSVKILPGGYTQADATAYFEKLSFEKGLPQTETMDIEGKSWYVIEKNSNALLLMEPETGRVDIKELSNGETLWSTNPSQADLAKEKVKGMWRRNLESPFILSYIKENTIAINMANTGGDVPAEIQWRKIKNGIGIQYTLKEVGFKIYLEFTLDDKGFSAHLPALGVLETGENKLTNIELLPFFGAAMDGVDGYLFVPDGPGSLISFNKKRIPGLVPYDFPIYGDDWAVPTTDFYSRRTDIAYPVFGIKRGDTGFMAIVEEGQFKANIVAVPAGTITDFNRVAAKFQIRRLYYRPKSLTSYVKSFEKDIVMDAVTIRYIFLPHKKADYVSMGIAYREYLMNEMGIKKLPNQAGAPPLLLDVVMGGTEQTPTGSRNMVVTTLDQIGGMVTDLQSNGIDKMKVSIQGWQNGGFPGKIPNKFPIDPLIGGNKGFIKLKEELKQKGISLALIDDLIDAAEGGDNNFSEILDTTRLISGVPMKYEQEGDWYSKVRYYFQISPQVVLDKLPQSIKSYKKLGVESVFASGLGNAVFSDFNSGHPLDRKATAKLFVQVLDEIKKSQGEVTSNGGFSYMLGHMDHAYQFPISKNYDFIIDQQVPFYPIAVHGLMTYSTSPGNAKFEPEADFLRDIEYGSLPTFVISHDDPGILQNTNYNGFFNSKYSVLNKQIVKDYRDYSLAETGVWSSFITDHRQVADKVFETTYENGKKIWVNYNPNTVEAEGLSINGTSFKVIAEGAKP